MKFKKLNYSQNLILRTPLGVNNKLNSISANFLIEEWKENTLFKEAVFLASPVLYNQFEKAIQNQEINDKLIFSIAKYYQRFCTRCTPFGLFSGVSTVSINKSDTNNIKISNNIDRFTRLDNHFLSLLIDNIEKDESFKIDIKYKRNSSLYALENSYRYIEYEIANNYKKYSIESIEKNFYLDSIIEFAGEYRSLESYIQILISDDITYNDALKFLMKLIDNQILVSDLEPSVVGDNPLLQLITKLKDYNNSKFNTIIDKLNELYKMLKQLDDNKINSFDTYSIITSYITDFNFEFDQSKLFQVDVYRPMNCNTLSEKVISEILEVLEFFDEIKLSDPNNLDSFIDKYKERYDTSIQPLVEVLDSDIGIGFSTNSIDKSNDDNDVSKELFEKYINVIENKENVIELSQNDFKKIKHNNFAKRRLPSSLSTMFSLVEVEGKEMIYLKSSGTNSALDFIGRFSHINESIEAIINEIKNHETITNQNALLADIVHLPEARVGNILTRKPIFDFHICYLGNSSFPKQNIIDVNDLYIEILNNTVYLKSKLKEKYIIPRLSNAHNYSSSTLPIYHFLCAIQNQAIIKSLSLNYGKLQRYVSKFPRITFKNIIISPALWIIEKSKFPKLFKGALFQYQKECKEYITKLNIPNQFLLKVHDNELFVNLNNDLSFSVFLDEIKSRDRIIIKEFLKPSKSVLSEKGSISNNEFILSLLNNNAVDYSPTAITNKKQSFAFGDEWLYFKIYGGPKYLENVFKLLLNEIVKYRDLYKMWFFIRYKDNLGYHLRIRFLVAKKGQEYILFQNIYSFFIKYLSKEYISNINIDKYRRELKRYQINSISIDDSERFFFYDSICIGKILLMGDSIIGDRILVGIYNVNDILDTFNYSLDDKLNIVKTLRNNFHIEFGAQKSNNEMVKNDYRNNKEDIELILPYFCRGKHPLELKIESIFKERRKSLKRMNLNRSDIDIVIDSYLHMSINRLFMENNRWYEFMIYALLEKYYLSARAYLKYNNINE